MYRDDQRVIAPASGDSEVGSDAVLTVRSLSKTYGVGAAAKTAIAELTFDVRRGEFVCIVGPSGAGKTTLLKCISGLLQPTSGYAEFEGQPIKEPPSKLAVVFQDYSRSLFPWMTVGANVALPLRGKGVGRRDRTRLVREALHAVGLADVDSKYPWQLSGGMQQRVAIARSLAYGPDCLVMDEPFASVDAQTRFDLEDLVLQVRKDVGVTVVFVTHDIDEAVYLADRVIVLSDSPCRVARVIDVHLPTPRDQITTKNDPQYAKLRTEVLELIRNRKTEPDA